MNLAQILVIAAREWDEPEKASVAWGMWPGAELG